MQTMRKFKNELFQNKLEILIVKVNSVREIRLHGHFYFT